MGFNTAVPNDTFVHHRLDCTSPDVHVARGVTIALLTCRSCGSEARVPIGEVS